MTRKIEDIENPKSLLKSLQKFENFGENHQVEVINNLITKIEKDDDLTLSEEMFISGILFTLISNEGEKIDIQSIRQCQNYWFVNRYLRYFRDLNGYGKVFDNFGEIPLKQKEKDLDFLNSELINWQHIVLSKNKSLVISEISSELKRHLKSIDSHCDSQNIGSIKRRYMKKSILLHSKHIYLLVKTQFEETTDESFVILCNNFKIVIDHYCYIHILFRHYASFLKEYQIGKSYHFDKNIEFSEVPSFIKSIIEIYIEQFNKIHFEDEFINFRYNETIYAIWLKKLKRSIKGNHIENLLRVQTFYPADNKTSLNIITNYKEVTINSQLSFFVR